MARSVIGLDIGSSSIKAVKIMPRGDDIELLAFSSVPLEIDVIKEGKVQDGEKVKTALDALVKEINPRGAKLITAIPGVQAFIRNIKMPKMKPKEMDEAIPWEMEQQLPFPVEDAIIDYVIRVDDEAMKVIDEGSEIDVMVVAAPRDVVESYLFPIQQAKLHPKEMNLQPFALYYAYLSSGAEEEIVALVDIGASTTDILVLKGDTLVLNRTVNVGGNDFREALMANRGLTYEEADDLLLQGNPDIDIKEELRVNYGDLQSEVSRSLVHYQIQHRGERVQKIFLSGGAAESPGLQEYLDETLDVPLTTMDLTNLFTMPEDLNKGLFISQHLTLVVSAGLALSEVMA